MTTLLTIGFIALFFVLMSVRILLKKNGTFKGTCASQNPYLVKEGTTCGYCGRTLDSETSCPDQDSEVEKVISKFK